MRTSKSRRRLTVNSYSTELRGLPQNKFGGHQTQQLRGFWTPGVQSGRGRRLSVEERRPIEAALKKQGLIS